MLKSYPKLQKGEVETIYKSLGSKEKTTLKEYLIYRKARGLNSDGKLNDVRRYIIQLRYLYQKDLKKMILKDYREILALVNSSELANNTKNHIKVDFRNFLKYIFSDWSEKFYGFEDVRMDSSRNEERINSHTIFTKEEINKLVSHENNLFWKAFLLLQYEGALRTIEVRTLKWDNVKFNVDGNISEINVFSSKTKTARTIFIKDSTALLKKLEEEQQNSNDKGVYVFHAKNNKNEPMNKATISVWFRRLTKKVLGREGWNYLLRHSRATELYGLAESNKISKDIAIKFMGHSKDMTATYTHLDKQKVKEMLKEQIYKEEELTPKEKNEIKELEKNIEVLQKNINTISENHDSQIESMQKGLDFLMGVKNNELPKKKFSEVIAEAPQRAKEYELLQKIKNK